MPQRSRHTEDLSCLSFTCAPGTRPMKNLNQRQWSAILSRHQGESKTEGWISPCQARWKEEPTSTKHCWPIQPAERMRVLHVPKGSQASEFPADHTEVWVQTGPAGSHKAKATLYTVGPSPHTLPLCQSWQLLTVSPGKLTPESSPRPGSCRMQPG